MLRIIKLILSTTLFSFSLSNIEIKQVRASWYDSGKQCDVAGLKTADITEIDNMVPDKNQCRKEEDRNTQYWIKNEFTFSNTISVEGCFISNDLETSVGRQSLLGCYRKYLQSPNAFSTFAFKNASGNLNCKFNFNATYLNANNWSISDCITYNKTWWKYRIHKSVVTTSKEYCQTISCTDIKLNNHFHRDILCGSFLMNNPIPDENLRYVCTENKTLSSTDMPRIFSFMLNASIAKDNDKSEPVFNKCNAIKCLNDSTYETVVTDCSSNMSGVICLNGTIFHMHSTNTPVKSSLSSLNVHLSHQTVNSSPHAPSRIMSTVLASKKTGAFASSASRQVHVTVTSEQLTTFFTASEAPDVKSLMTYISSNSKNHVTSSDKGSIIHSTSHEVLNKNINADSPIGLLVGLIVTALVIVAVVVLLVVCRFKRKGPFRNKTYGDDSQKTKFDSTNLNEKDITSNTKTQTVENSTYDMHTARENENKFSLSDPDSNNLNNTSKSEYAVVIKIKQMTGNTMDHQQSNDAEDLGEIENEYDGFNHNRPDSFTDRNNTTNIYDIALGFRDKSDSTYVTANHVHVVDKDENNVYDHM